jgi:hypothetical protein
MTLWIGLAIVVLITEIFFAYWIWVNGARR